MIIRQPGEFRQGYTAITTAGQIHPEMLMDFGILRLGVGDVFRDEACQEKAYLLITGTLALKWGERQQVVTRASCFDENPFCLHVDKGTVVELKGLADSEVAVVRTANDGAFEPKLYEPAMCAVEERGKGTMKETSTRLVRTIFDDANAPYANLVLGEVIGFPGKWSSYPPHHHPQPEIYFYKFHPGNGFGFSELGDDAYKLKANDTVLITAGQTHAQVASPGHALYYLWVIRHLEGNRYRTPIFLDEYQWLMSPDAVIWPDKK